MELPVIDINKICRICFEENVIISLYNPFNCQMRVCDVLMECTNLKIHETDSLPHGLCNNCFYRLQYTYQFKQQCENADAKLREYLGINIAPLCLTTHEPISDITKDCNILTKNDCNPEHDMTVPTISDSSTQVKDEEIYAAMNVMCDLFSEQQNSIRSNEMIDIENIPLVHDANTVLTEHELDDVNEIITNSEEQLIKQLEQATQSTQPIELEVEPNPEPCVNKPFEPSPARNTKAKLNKLLAKHKKQQQLKKLATKRDTNFRFGDKILLKVPEKCLECGKMFRYSGYLESHVRTHTGERPFECDMCDKKFAQAGNLVLHKRTHTGERPFQCDVCSKLFTTSSNLTAHQRIHSDIRSFKCNECPRAFRSIAELRSHEGTHTQVKNHICTECGKTFFKTAYLNVHIRTVHIGEKKHQCPQCGKEFANSSNLTCHFRIHTGEKPFSCQYCEAKFNQSSALVRHKKQHLNDNSKKRKVRIKSGCLLSL